MHKNTYDLRNKIIQLEDIPERLLHLKDAYKVAYQNYSKKYYDISEGYFNGGYEVDEKRCTEVTWKVSYKWKNSGIN